MTTNIYALGDSITYGFPYGPHQSWVGMVAQQLNISIFNGGNNGDTTTFLRRRLQHALDRNPSHLIILGGTNDAYWGQPLKIVGENVGAICSKCVAVGIQPIMGLPIPVDEPQVAALLSDYRAFMSDLAQKEGFPIIPFHRAFLDENKRFKTELTTDGCHPNIDGYEAMAEVAEQVLPKILV